jgi:hypothetical protein
MELTHGFYLKNGSFPEPFFLLQPVFSAIPCPLHKTVLDQIAPDCGVILIDWFNDIVYFFFSVFPVPFKLLRYFFESDDLLFFLGGKYLQSERLK